jgi:hypothetical protein
METRLTELPQEIGARILALSDLDTIGFLIDSVLFSCGFTPANL